MTPSVRLSWCRPRSELSGSVSSPDVGDVGACLDHNADQAAAVGQHRHPFLDAVAPPFINADDVAQAGEVAGDHVGRQEDLVGLGGLHRLQRVGGPQPDLFLLEPRHLRFQLLHPVSQRPILIIQRTEVPCAGHQIGHRLCGPAQRRLNRVEEGRGGILDRRQGPSRGQECQQRHQNRHAGQPLAQA